MGVWREEKGQLCCSLMESNGRGHCLLSRYDQWEPPCTVKPAGHTDNPPHWPPQHYPQALFECLSKCGQFLWWRNHNTGRSIQTCIPPPRPTNHSSGEICQKCHSGATKQRNLGFNSCDLMPFFLFSILENLCCKQIHSKRFLPFFFLIVKWAKKKHTWVELPKESLCM